MDSINNSNAIPRRMDVERHTPCEHAIRFAMRAVEQSGAHPLLTDAVVLLQQAFDKVADYVDLQPVADEVSPC